MKEGFKQQDQLATKIELEENEVEKEPKKLSSDYWYSGVISGEKEGLSENELETEMIEQLKQEVPTLISAVLERACTLQCEHCIFQKEKSSKKTSEKEQTLDTILSMVKQMPEKGIDGAEPKFLHCGRILTPSHIKLFSEITKERPDVKIGLIDNGGYARYIDKFKQANVKLDWIDISLDGTEETHNIQRDPGKKKAFNTAINGLKHAREVIKSEKDGGYVASLFTITKLNFHDIEKTADILFSQVNKDKVPLADKMAITTITPLRERHTRLETDMVDFAEVWKQIKNVHEKYGEKVIFHLYRHQDVEKLAYVVGAKRFVEIMENETLIDLDNIVFVIDGISVQYSPLSTWPKEEITIDADSAIRLALSGRYTLDEYNKEVSHDDGSSIGKFTVTKATPQTDYVEIYKKSVDQWWQNFGKDFLREEIETFNRIRKKAEEEN